MPQVRGSLPGHALYTRSFTPPPDLWQVVGQMLQFPMVVPVCDSDVYVP